MQNEFYLSLGFILHGKANLRLLKRKYFYKYLININEAFKNQNYIKSKTVNERQEIDL